MSNAKKFQPNPKFDLVLERVVDVPRELVWAAWTQPEHLKQWYCPLPWKTVECEIDLRPGGLFKTVMQSPEGQNFPHIGCWLEVVKNEKLVWTDALEPGFRPATTPMLGPVGYLTVIVAMEPQGKGTKYTAMAIHKDEAGAKKHEEMGFYDGWGTVLDQMVAMIKAWKP